MERMDFDLLFRWFVGVGIDDAVWDHSVFSKNRDRLLNTEIAQAFLAALLSEPRVKRLLSHEHFSVDGTLLQAWASMKSFRPKDGGGDPPDGGRNGEQNFRGEKRSNETHEGTTDPDARLYRKGDGRESRLCYMGHAVMENRNGLAICGEVTHATGTAEREVVLAWLDERPPRHAGGRQGLRRLRLCPSSQRAQCHAAYCHQWRDRSARHCAQNSRRPTHHSPSRLCDQPVHPQAEEEIFGWVKSTGGLDQLKVRGIEKAKTTFVLGLEDRCPLFGIMLWQTMPRRLPQERARTAIGRKRRRLPVSICGACGARMGRAWRGSDPQRADLLPRRP